MAQLMTPEIQYSAIAASSINNTPSTDVPQDFSKFLELPAEIRIMIYCVVFGDALELACSLRRGRWTLFQKNTSGGPLVAVGYERLGVQILQVSHAIRDEAAPIFWGHHTFFATSSLNAEDLAVMIGLQNARLIRKLILGMWGRKSHREIGWAGEHMLDKQCYFTRHIVPFFTGLQDLTINGVFTRNNAEIKWGRNPADHRLSFFKQKLPHLSNPIIQLKDESARLTSPEIKANKAAKMYDYQKSLKLRKEKVAANRRALNAKKRALKASQELA